MIAHVVPVLRLRRATAWWSYSVPKHLHCEPGSLVCVPFRGKLHLGVVWSLDDADENASEQIKSVLCAVPLVKAPSRALIEWMSTSGFISLSTALYTWLPTALRHFPVTQTAQKILATVTKAPTALEMANLKQQLVVLPSKRPESTVLLKKKFDHKILDLSEDLNPHAELLEWISILQGEKTVIVGREKGVMAPFLNLQHVFIQEPEDIAFYHEQLPYISFVEAAKALATYGKAQLTIRSFLPSDAAQLLWGEDALGTQPQGNVSIVDLTKEDLLSDSLLEKIIQTSKSQKVLILYNAHDRTITQEDGTTIVLPGIESLKKQLAKAIGQAALPPSIVLDTRAMFTALHKNVGLTVIISLDPLLTNPSFADQVHGWGDIGRLLSYNSPCIIQAKKQDHPLMMALRNAQFPGYCLDVIRQRNFHQLPPFSTTIVCSFNATESSGEILTSTHLKIQSLLEKAGASEWQLSHPFAGKHRKKSLEYIMLYSSSSQRLPITVSKYLTALQRPWKILFNPWFVL